MRASAEVVRNRRTAITIQWLIWVTYIRWLSFVCLSTHRDGFHSLCVCSVAELKSNCSPRKNFWRFAVFNLENMHNNWQQFNFLLFCSHSYRFDWCVLVYLYCGFTCICLSISCVLFICFSVHCFFSVPHTIFHPSNDCEHVR